MNKDKDMLGSAPIGRLLFTLALPTVLAQIINMLYSVVDRIFIGHIPEIGAAALTGVGVCTPVLMLVSAFSALVGSGGAPRASIDMGKGDKDSAEKILGSCFTALIVISVALTIALLVFGRELLMAFGASANTINYAVDYMNMYALGTVFVQLTLGMNAFITAQGYSKISMLTVVIGAVLNIALDPVFIYLFDMGVRGAALATVISQAVSCAWCLKFLFGEKTQLRIRKKNLKINFKVLLPCFALGLATFIMQGSESVIAVCFNASLQKYGGDAAVGAMTICTSAMLFVMLPLTGIGQGAQPILGYNFGAKKKDRLLSCFKLLLVTCLVYSVALWAILMLFPGAVASVFASDQSLVSYAGKALRIYCAGLLGMGIQIACQMTFVSVGNAPCSIMVAVFRKFVLLLPLIYILPHIAPDKVTGVYLAEPVADVIAVTFTAILFAFQFKKALKQMDAKA
ncbi:MAG: MATE family efflux transporter [Clostridia bacterium]|nr:MATE family efflux transporter [Clostridia bacterium]